MTTNQSKYWLVKITLTERGEDRARTAPSRAAIPPEEGKEPVVSAECQAWRNRLSATRAAVAGQLAAAAALQLPTGRLQFQLRCLDEAFQVHKAGDTARANGLVLQALEAGVSEDLPPEVWLG